MHPSPMSHEAAGKEAKKKDKKFTLGSFSVDDFQVAPGTHLLWLQHFRIKIIALLSHCFSISTWMLLNNVGKIEANISVALNGIFCRLLFSSILPSLPSLLFLSFLSMRKYITFWVKVRVSPDEP